MRAFRKPSAAFSSAQQTSLYYIRKRRRARQDASTPHNIITRERSYLGLQVVVELQVATP